MPSVGTILDGKYRLVRQLGAGGMGIVYEADHIRLRQPFAIKILQPELASEHEFLMRFEREARAAASLRSPHVVRVFDVDASPEGLTYIVMELLEGRDLADESLSTKIPLPQLIDWIVQTCAGLQEAHDNGIVHRDLKPANVFLSKIESGDRIAKVLDFGISKVDATSTSLLTGRAAGALGTPTYMAPEQIRNRSVDGMAKLREGSMPLSSTRPIQPIQSEHPGGSISPSESVRRNDRVRWATEGGYPPGSVVGSITPTESRTISTTDPDLTRDHR